MIRADLYSSSTFDEAITVMPPKKPPAEKPSHWNTKYGVNKVAISKRVLPCTAEWLADLDSEVLDLLWIMIHTGIIAKPQSFEEGLEEARYYLSYHSELLGYEGFVDQVKNTAKILKKRAKNGN
jgi:hypothetical protein